MFEIKCRMCRLYASQNSDLQVHIGQNCASQKVSQYYLCDEFAGVSDPQWTIFVKMLKTTKLTELSNFICFALKISLTRSCAYFF